MMTNMSGMAAICAFVAMVVNTLVAADDLGDEDRHGELNVEFDDVSNWSELDVAGPNISGSSEKQV
jgi:hypothetical protein